MSTTAPGLRELPPTWKGGLLLVCRKCQKRAGRRTPDVRKALKKTLGPAVRGKRAPWRLVKGGCLKVCPGGGRVCVVATGAGPDRLFLVGPGEEGVTSLARLLHGRAS